MASTNGASNASNQTRDSIELTTNATNGADHGQTNIVETQDVPYEGDMLSGLAPKRMVIHDDDDSKEGGAIVAGLTEIGDSINEIRNMKYSHWECLCYFMFLIVFTTMAILARGGDVGYCQTLSIRNSLIELDEFVPWNDNGEKNFEAISTIEDIYRWLDYVALPFLLNEHDDFYAQTQSRLLGGIRLKQLRVPTTECTDDVFSNETCFVNDEVETSDLSYYWSNGSFAGTWTYQTSEDLSDQSWRGKYGTYEGAGYIVDLPLDYVSALAIMDQLRDMQWMDGGTRFLTIDFNLYNPSTHLYTLARLTLEMPVGGVFPNDELKTWRFDRYYGSTGSILLVFHLIFAVSLILLAIMELWHGWHLGCCTCVCSKLNGCPLCGLKLCRPDAKYWSSGWKYLDAVNFFFFSISIYVYVNNEIYRRDPDRDWLDPDDYVSFRQLQYGWTMESYCNAVNGLLLWLKLFKYMTVHKRLRFLFTMLGASAVDIIMFTIVLGVFIIAFGTCGFMTFTSDVDDFRSYPMSLGNMIRFTISEMDYDNLTVSSRLWGSFFYFMWSLLMLLILANVFIAILSEAYAQVNADLQENAKPINFFGSLRRKLTGRNGDVNAEDLKQELIDEDGDGQIDAKELAEACGVPLERAIEVIAENDKDGDGTLNIDEFEKLKEMLIREQEEMARSVSMREFNELKRDLARMTKLLGEVWKETPSGRKYLRRRSAKSPDSGYSPQSLAVNSPPKGKTETADDFDYLAMMDDIDDLDHLDDESVHY